jgi:hypothetical protein
MYLLEQEMLYQIIEGCLASRLRIIGQMPSLSECILSRSSNAGACSLVIAGTHGGPVKFSGVLLQSFLDIGREKAQKTAKQRGPVTVS